jgi:hydroxymethylglutaryl-CoA reductase
MKSSDISGFYKLPVKDRIKIVREFAQLTDDEVKILEHNSALGIETADIMIENVISTTQLPVGIATHFKINDVDRLVPMAIEETSVVAAASHAAKLARPAGGFRASSDESIMIGQIQLMGIKNISRAKNEIKKRFGEIKKFANGADSTIVKLGGGLKDVEVRELTTERGKMLVVHLLIDVRDAMGANVVNTYCETVAPYIEKISGGRAVIKIISNLAVHRLARARAVWKKEILGEELIEGMLDAYALAKNDPFRAATHNKGIMNAIDAVIIATGNDWRAIESGAHAFAAMNGQYGPLTRYEKDKHGDLVGYIELPMAVGIVGGATKIHPVSRLMLKILGIKSAAELGQIAACVGLANNFAAMRAIVKEGIRRGHMELHATNIAHMAGAHGKEIELVANRLIQENNISYSRAKELIKIVRRELRKEKIEKIIKRVKKKVKHRKNKTLG